MEQPIGFIQPQSKHQVCYNFVWIQTAPRAWFERLINFLIELGFIGSKADRSLFYRFQNNQCCYIVIYFDDIILTGSSPSKIQQLIIH